MIILSYESYVILAFIGLSTYNLMMGLTRSGTITIEQNANQPWKTKTLPHLSATTKMSGPHLGPHAFLELVAQSIDWGPPVA